MVKLFQGQQASISKAFTDADVRDFARLSGDNNLVHLDEEYAAGTVFGKRIVHGKLVEGLLSAILGTELPGPMTVFRSCESTYLLPVYLDEEVTMTARVVCSMPKGEHWIRIIFSATQGDRIVMEGTATVTLPKDQIEWA